ncbi:MAG: 4'-phosphopantetheinyl transferase sfp [bacterium ADurb.Bin243]|nr:MAG: 4'-phosphopantetheinyl transferase sfp [bacterium ADurb.Bin243]
MSELYALDVNSSRDFIISDAAIKLVSIERLEASRKFRKESDFLLSMGGELLARAIIREKLKIKNDDINFGRTYYGKPFLKGVEGFHFNVSHSGGLVICAISNIEIGCDCEFISEENKIDEIRIVYTDNEYKLIRSFKGPEKTLLCHKIWALKESYLKCAGIGLSEEPGSLEISFGGESPAVYKNGRRLDYRLKLYGDIKSYAMAACIKNGAGKAIESLPDKIIFTGRDFLSANILK